MKKLLVIFLTASLFASCKKDEVQVYEPTFDNYSRIFKIIEVSKDKIVLKNNSGETLYADQYLYSTKDTTEVRVSTDITMVPHQSTYTVIAAKPIDFKKDTIFLIKEDITSNNSITKDTVDIFYPAGNIGF